MQTATIVRDDAQHRRRRPTACLVAALWCVAAGVASPLLAAQAETTPNAAPGVSTESPAAAGANSERIPDKVRRYAQRLLQRHDANGDGKLQRAEWSKMHGAPESADTDGDGVITLDELVNTIAVFGRNRRIGSAPTDAEVGSPDPSPAAGPASASGEPAQRSATFHVPKSRLPSGLPDWFLRRDLDGDGQLSLSEYAPSPTQADLENFTRYDRNGDGYITAKECLGATRPAKPAARKSAEKASGKKNPGGGP